MTHLLTFLSLVLLVFLNMMLFYKLWMLEYSAQSLTTWQGLRLHERYTHTHTNKVTDAHSAHFLFIRVIMVNGLLSHLRIQKLYLITAEMRLNGVLLYLFGCLPRKQPHTSIHIQLQTYTCTHTHTRTVTFTYTLNYIHMVIDVCVRKTQSY